VETHIARTLVSSAGVFIVTLTVFFTLRTKGNIKGVKTKKVACTLVNSAGVFIVTLTVFFTLRTKGNIKGVGTKKVAFVPSAGVRIVTIFVDGALGNFIKIEPHFCPEFVDIGGIILVIGTNAVAIIHILYIRKSLNSRATIGAPDFVAETN
jgi:hypothetical protein